MGIVQKGDKIHVPASELLGTKVTVEWQQNLGKRSQDYYSVTFVNKSQGDEKSLLFISTSYVDSFKSKKVSGAGWFDWLMFWRTPEGDYTVIVDDSFQYGQNSDKSSRWLAYHDKSMKAYQWRFVASMKSMAGSELANIGGGIFEAETHVDVSALAGMIGDPLHDF
ncbi:hypothetical protein CkaCkLH20_09460 [Colletotrichum karsti]|uniref:Uncharacterized protein n=1 Tax=Colletotrichum karsti TaxID=1095194 RepID=A0A9P6I6L7_9PEZI|nr:uncharacterized protein CkaCkLH20_09460 [Colletotrichum karsti]KAF9872950.1 hypothetical protein CkaCkLH20_09460 [Colletotrichum karsti]